MRTTVSIPTSIWTDPEFTALTCSAQVLYLTLWTRPERSNAGLMPLMPQRWAGWSRGTTPEGILEALTELEATGYAFADHELQEVVLRLLVPPAGHKHVQGALQATLEIHSPRLRQIAATAISAVGHDSRAATSKGDPRFARMRLAVHGRDGFSCLRCGWAPALPAGYDGRHALGEVVFDDGARQYRVRILELDHVYPESLGGKFTLENLQTLCNSCNASKGASV